MKVKLSQAAEMVGVTSRTLLNKVKSGKISSEKIDGAFHVDISELSRVYKIKDLEGSEETRSTSKNNEKNLENEQNKIELKHALEKIKSLENQLEKAESREESLMEIARSNQKLLENNSKKSRKFLGLF